MRTFFSILLLTWAVQAGAADAAGVAFIEQAISLHTGTGEIHGSLVLPNESGKAPVALIIAGSGPTDRDGNTRGMKGGNDSLKMLAKALAQAGIASVRYDKRGIAASTAAQPSEAELRFDTYVQDAAAWLDMLRQDKRFQGLAVIGHSEGSLIGMLAAKQGNADAFVSIAGPAQRASVLLREQLKGKLPATLEARNEAILTALEQGKTAGDVPPELQSLYHASVQPYLISWFRYQPDREFGALSIPSQIIQGDTDLQVHPADAQALKRARPDAELVIVKGMNHVLKMAPAEPATQIASYSDPSLSISGELSEALTRFLTRTLRR